MEDECGLPLSMKTFYGVIRIPPTRRRLNLILKCVNSLFLVMSFHDINTCK